MSDKKRELITSFFEGTFRYRVYYSKYKKYLPEHIVEQYQYRLQHMDKECYNSAQCKMCGCDTPALQFANRSCEKPCYPPMMTKDEWKIYKKTGYYVDKGRSTRNLIVLWRRERLTGKPILEIREK